jgi:hypothetical protein
MRRAAEGSPDGNQRGPCTRVAWHHSTVTRNTIGVSLKLRKGLQHHPIDIIGPRTITILVKELGQTGRSVALAITISELITAPTGPLGTEDGLGLKPIVATFLQRPNHIGPRSEAVGGIGERGVLCEFVYVEVHIRIVV